MSKVLFIACAVFFILAVLAAVFHGMVGTARYPWMNYVIGACGGLGFLSVLGGVALRLLKRR